MKYRLIFFVALINFLLINTLSFSRDPSVIRRSGKIYVGMTIDDRKNINYQLAVEFAKYLNVELVIVDMDWEEAFMKDGKVPPEIETDPLISYTPDIFKKVDIICSTFTVLDWRKNYLTLLKL
ncbi:MAG: hypothetical protein IPJ37_14470 [Bacteroidales bacterium]|nr:hypothetical protein [Bacteroidales bacterium]